MRSDAELNLDGLRLEGGCRRHWRGMSRLGVGVGIHGWQKREDMRGWPACIDNKYNDR